MKKFLIILLSAFTLLFTACESWMQDDAFYSDIEHDVKVANATQISAYVRYANTRQGKTNPEGFATFKVDVPSSITATTEMEYGFVRWVAFPQSFITPQRQNSTLYFVDDEDYETNFLPYELSSSEVSFDNPTNPTTNVTIKSARSDIYILPLIAQRPAIGLSIPGSGETGVVKNTSVRINFTKPMNRDSFMNSDFEWDKITVTEGTTTSDANGDIDVSSRDISIFKPANFNELPADDPARDIDYIFESPTFSTSQKTITLKFTDEALANGFTSNAKVSVKVSKDVTDIFGFNMTNDEKINFTIGNGTDILAPRIKQLTGGMFGRLSDSSGTLVATTKLDDFKGRYKQLTAINTLGTKTKMGKVHGSAGTGDLKGSDEIWTEAASKTVSEFLTSYPTMRVGSKLILRVEAVDIATAGEGQTEQELDVASVSMRSRPVYLASNSEGSYGAQTYYTTNGGYSAVTSGGYSPQRNATSLSGSYGDLVSGYPSSYEFSDSNGSLVEYNFTLDENHDGNPDVDIPDGLIQVDVWAMDVIGNRGNNTANVVTSEANSWASIFVVKDTLPPVFTGASGFVFKNGTEDVDSRFYNLQSFNNFKINADNGTTKIIQDQNFKENANANLASKHEDLRWMFKAFADNEEAQKTKVNGGWTSQLSTTGKSWKKVEDDYDFGDYTNVAGATEEQLNSYGDYKNSAPTEDGEITLVYALMDDVGNISEPQILRTFNYDNTSPELTDNLSWSVTDENAAAGTEAGVDNASVLSEQTLVIPVKEKNPATTNTETKPCSGMEAIKLDVSNGGTVYHKPFVKADLTIKINGDIIPNSYYDVESSDSTQTDYADKLVFNSYVIENYLQNAEATIEITGINIANPTNASAPEGTYTIKATLIDAAGNTNNVDVTDEDGVTTHNNAADNAVTLAVDSTAPAISRMYIPDVMKVKRASDGSIENWVKYGSTNFTQTGTSIMVAKYVYFTFTEENSGAKIFDFTGTNMSFTTSTKFYKVDSVDDVTGTLLAGNFDTTRKIYTLNAGLCSTPANAGAGTEAVPVTVLITDVQLASASYNSKINLKIKDRAKKESAPKLQFDSDNGNTNVSEFCYDLSYPTVSTIVLEDKETETDCSAALSGYTNNQYIKAHVTVYPTTSGIYSLTIDGDAVFEEGTTTFTDSTGTVINLSYPYDSTSPNQYSKTVEFKYSATDETPAVVGTSGSTSSRIISITGLKLCKSDNTHPDGSYTVKFIPKSFAGRQDATAATSRKSQTIVLDTVSPEWENDGIYADTSSVVDNKLVYPTPKEGVKKWGIKGIGSTDEEKQELYFYKNSLTTYIKIFPSVSDTNERTGESFILFTKNGSSFSNSQRYIQTTGNGVYTFTAQDKAGNHSDTKTVHIVNDTAFDNAVANELSGFMTLTPPDGASLFKNTVRGSENYASDYVFNTDDRSTYLYSYNWIYKATDENHPYEVRIKIGKTPVTKAREKNLNEADFDTTGDKFSRTEASANYAPITEYAVSHWYKEYPSGYWGSNCSFNALYPYDTNIDTSYKVSESHTTHKWHEYKKPSLKQNSITDYEYDKKAYTGFKSYVDENKDIVIEIYEGKIPPLTLMLKDGCGNVIQQMIKPNSTLDGVDFSLGKSGVSWISDGDVGDFTAELSSGIINPKGDGISADVNFYNDENVKVTFKNCTDSCLYSSSGIGTDSDYTIKAGLLKWTGTSAPGVNDFTGTNVTWVGYKLSSASTQDIEIVLPHDSTNTTPYNLYYIFEDQVGNKTQTPKQLKYSYNTEENQKWLFDNTAPTAAVITPLTNTNKVNQIDGHNYFSTGSTVNYQITENGSGVSNDGTTPYPYNTFAAAKRTSSFTSTPFPVGNYDGGTIKIRGIADHAGNGDTNLSDPNGGVLLECNSISDWVKMTNAPTLPSSDVASADSSGVIWTEPSSDTIPGVSITAKADSTSIDVTLKVNDTTQLLGWYVKDDTPFNSSASAISSDAFYSKSLFYGGTDGTVWKGSTNGTTFGPEFTYTASTKSYTYTVTKSDATSAWPASTKYFYPVNRAGLIATTPVMVEFKANPIPAITTVSGSTEPAITYNNVVSYGTKRYIKSNSSISFSTDAATPSDTTLRYKIYGDSESSPYVSGTLTGDGTSRSISLSQLGLTNLSDATLKLRLYYEKSINGSTRTVAESPEYPLTSSTWTYDETPPSISIDTANIKAATETATPGTYSLKDTVEVSGTYYLRGDYAYIPYTTSDTDIASFWRSTDGGTTYVDITSAVDTTNKVIKFAAPTDTDGTTYLFKAQDEAGNSQTTTAPETAITLKKDNVGPAITGFTPSYYKDASPVEDSTYYKVSTDASGVITFTYQPTQVTQIVFNYTATDGIDATHTSGGSGFAGIYYRVTGTAETDTDGTLISSNKITLSGMSSGTSYDIFAKDNVGNETPIKTYIFTSDYTAPNFTLADTNPVKASAAATDATGIYLNSSIYYVNGTSPVISFATTTPDDIDHYEWDQGTGTYPTVAITDLAYTISSLPDTAVDADHAVTYYFRAVDKVGNSSTPATVTLVKDMAEPVENTPVTYTPSGTENTDYIKSEVSGTITYTYNPSVVDKLTFDFTGVSDAASGIKEFVYRTGSGESTVTEPIPSTGLSLTSGSTPLTGTYQILAIDNVGNEKLLKTIVLKTNIPAPAQTVEVSYNGSNRAYVSDNPNTYTASYDPKVVSVDGGNAVIIPSSATFDISMTTATVLNNTMYYAVTYIPHSSSLPDLTAPTTGWTEVALVDGKLSVTVNGSALSNGNNHIFIWFKDVIGNTAVYGLAYKGDKSWQSGWWTKDVTGPTSSNFSLTFKKNNGTANADDKYKSLSSDNTTITYSGQNIDTISVGGSSSLTDSGAGISDQSFYYRVEGEATGTKVGSDKKILTSVLTEGSTYEIYAKDDWGNETVFKKIIMDKTGPALGNITVGAYGFYKQNETNPVTAGNGYTELAPTEDGTIEFKYNTGLKTFKVPVSSTETGVSIKKVIGTNNPADYDGSINLGNSAEIKLIAVDSLWNETIVRKYKFTVDSTQTLSNINGTSTAGIIPAGSTKSSVVKLNSGTSDNSRSGARFIQFFNNVQNVFTRNNEYEETSYNPAAVEVPVTETKKAAAKNEKKEKKSAKKTSPKPADVVAAVTEMATTVAEKGSVSEVELPVQVEELTETVEQSVTPVAEAVEPAPVTTSEDSVTQSTPSSVLPFLILLLVFGAFGSFVLMFIRKIKK